jgi:hypothetical protein
LVIYKLRGLLISYISKTEKNISQLLQNAVKQTKNLNSNVTHRLKIISNVFVNSSEISVQEAVYNILGMHLSYCSRKSVWINTSPKNERVRLIKSQEVLQFLQSDSHDIFVDGLIEHYIKRPLEMDNLCLAEVAVWFNIKFNNINNFNDIDNDDDDNNICPFDEEDYSFNNKKATFAKRKQSKILRYRRYMLEIDPNNYYREQIMLYLPFRKEIETDDYKDIYYQNENVIKENHVKLNGEYLDQDLIDGAVERARKDNLSESDKSDTDESLSDSEDYNSNIFAEMGIDKKSCFENTCQYSNCIVSLSSIDLFRLLRELNNIQRRILINLICLYKNDMFPTYQFVTGSAGTGKTKLIKAIYQYFNKIFNMNFSSESDLIKILLFAPTGKAAYNIEGQTTFSAFFLPINRSEYSSLDNYPSILNTFRVKYKNLKLLIIYEISMIGSQGWTIKLMD